MYENIYAPTLFIEITNKCNLGCEYCYIHDKGEEQNGGIIYSDIIDAINRINPGKLIFTGGEPMLKADMIKSAMEYYNVTEKNHWKTILMSNLTFWLSDIAKAVISMMDYIQTTFRLGLLDNDRYRSNIKYILSTGVQLDYMITLDQSILSCDPKEVLHKLKDLNCGQVCSFGAEMISFSKKNDMTNTEINEYYEQADEYMLKLFKEAEKLDSFNNLTVDGWKKARMNDISLVCNVCQNSNCYTLNPITKKLDKTCPCYREPNNTDRKKKFMDMCKDCEYYDLCKLNCERFGYYCAFPKKTVAYYMANATL